MARIMCTQKLWRRLGQLGRPPADVVAPPIHGASLGSWGAKVFRHQRRDLVIGVNERTYLSVVFPLAPRMQFRSNFAAAVAVVLRDLGTVQLNLNEVPHAGLEPCVPSEAVRRLFEAAPLRTPSFAAH